MALNEPSLTRFESAIKANGHLLYNQTLIRSKPSRTDIKILPITASAVAEELGTGKIANMVMLGSYAKETGVIKLSSLQKAQKIVFKKARAEMLKLNDTALERGFGLV